MKAPLNSCFPAVKSVKDMISISMENLHLVPMARLVRMESIATRIMRETEIPTTIGLSVVTPKSSRKRVRKPPQKER